LITMSTTTLFLTIAVVLPIAALVIVGGGAAAIAAVRAWRTYRGVHVIRCPETGQPAAVRVDTRRAAMEAAAERTPTPRLASCSRWPEKAGCDQACVPRIQRAPDETRLETILEDIFTGQSCTLCGRVITGTSAAGRRPAFRAADGRTTPCDAITAERVYDTWETDDVICWNCDVAETFRREHPERVTDVPEREVR
jgi:hypothetical protein